MYRFLVLFVLAVSLQVRAISGYLSMGYGQGGSKLSELTGNQDYNTRAGDGILALFGVILPVSPTEPHRFEAQLGGGLLFQNANSGDNLVSWTRYPIEALYFYRNTREQFRLGWGGIYTVSGKIKGRGINSSADADVDNAFGTTLAAEKYWGSAGQNLKSWSLGLRGQFIKYKSDRFSNDADGSAWFLTFSGYEY